MTGGRRRLGRAARIVAGIAVLALVAALVHVGTAMTGRGGRSVAGERRVVSSQAAPDIVYYARSPLAPRTPRTPRTPNRDVPIFLLASFARSVADFNELTASLAEAGYRTYAVESRGIGGSGGGGPGRDLTLHDLAADLARVVDRESPDRAVHVVGHAFGNRVVRTFARDHPTRVESVVLIAAGGLIEIEPEVVEALGTSTASFLPRRTRIPALRLAFFSPESEIPEDWIGGWWLWGGFAQRNATAATSSDDFWDAGEAPMLVLQAEDDRIAPPADSGLRLAASYPERVELVMIPAAGHALLPEQPRRIHSAMLAYYADDTYADDTDQADQAE